MGTCIPDDAGDPGRVVSEEAARYEAMEKAAPSEVQDFRGGNVAVYVSTGAAIVIAVILLVLFL